MLVVVCGIFKQLWTSVWNSPVSVQAIGPALDAVVIGVVEPVEAHGPGDAMPATMAAQTAVYKKGRGDMKGSINFTLNTFTNKHKWRGSLFLVKLAGPYFGDFGEHAQADHTQWGQMNNAVESALGSAFSLCYVILGIMQSPPFYSELDMLPVTFADGEYTEAEIHDDRSIVSKMFDYAWRLCRGAIMIDLLQIESFPGMLGGLFEDDADKRYKHLQKIQEALDMWDALQVRLLISSDLSTLVKQWAWPYSVLGDGEFDILAGTSVPLGPAGLHI